MRKGLFLVLILTLRGASSAQTLEEWSENVGWDGVMHWSEYLIFSPKFTGPNAMPVPEISNGTVNNKSFVRLGGQYQGRSGDQTGNLTFSAGHAFLKDRIAVDVFMVPIEFYDLSNDRKIERNVYFEHFDKKTAIGDLYVNTNIQLLNEENSWLDLAVRIGLKTASSGLDNPARFIDSPGYYFDVSVGKSFTGERFTFRPYGMIGFFAWQTNDESLRQNDAVLYGAGLKIGHNGWEFDQSLRGYSGYHNIGDKPVLLMTSLRREVGGHQLHLNYQYGIRDYLYQGVELSFEYVISRQ